MKELDDIIARSTQNIEHKYINLPIDSGPPSYRERVYCYELYHQMRCLWPINCLYTLNGEVSKQGHPILRKQRLESTPDLLVHSPGSMAGNHAVIEVKSCRADKRGITKDIQTLSRFTLKAHYERAIYVLYDTYERIDLFNYINNIYKEIGSQAAIEIWLHDRPSAPAKLSGTLRPNVDADSNPFADAFLN